MLDNSIIIIDIIMFFVSLNQYVNYFKDLIIFYFSLFIVIGTSNKNDNKPKGTTENQLNELTEMLNKGTIIQDEYDTKQNEIKYL